MARSDNVLFTSNNYKVATSMSFLSIAEIFSDVQIYNGTATVNFFFGQPESAKVFNIS